MYLDVFTHTLYHIIVSKNSAKTHQHSRVIEVKASVVDARVSHSSICHTAGIRHILF